VESVYSAVRAVSLYKTDTLRLYRVKLWQEKWVIKLRTMHVCDHISLNSSYRDKYFRHTSREKNFKFSYPYFGHAPSKISPALSCAKKKSLKNTGFEGASDYYCARGAHMSRAGSGSPGCSEVGGGMQMNTYVNASPRIGIRGGLPSHHNTSSCVYTYGQRLFK
jgi:hypothetical protein